MKATTSGHLSTNGGVRGHSAGGFFPFRIMAQGHIDNLTWWVIRPNGQRCAGYRKSSQAIARAGREYARFTA